MRLVGWQTAWDESVRTFGEGLVPNVGKECINEKVPRRYESD